MKVSGPTLVELQSWNAHPPILVTELGMRTLCIEVQPSKHQQQKNDKCLMICRASKGLEFMMIFTRKTGRLLRNQWKVLINCQLSFGVMSSRLCNDANTCSSQNRWEKFLAACWVLARPVREVNVELHLGGLVHQGISNRVVCQNYKYLDKHPELTVPYNPKNFTFEPPPKKKKRVWFGGDLPFYGDMFTTSVLSPASDYEVKTVWLA